ncbi:MAG TPA: LysR family transcriptional regulator [Bacillota bacterium]|nr:LysR family transcriptional regulator [Bacillota bacterium]
MKVEDYSLLIKLNEVGTIRGTAKEVLISQPAVSQRLRYIEKYFNTHIFIRTPKQLIITPEGELILEFAKDVLEKEQQLKNKLLQTSEEVRGTLSIACSTLVSQRFLPKILANFTEKFPHVVIDLVTGISETIKNNYDDYHICIIRGTQLKESVSKLLFSDPLYLFDTEPFSKNVMKNRPLISFKTDDSMNELVDTWLNKQAQIKPIKTITVDQIETCKRFMMEGIGMAVLPQSVSESLMDEYPHMPLKIEGQLVTRDTWACFKEANRSLPQVSSFIDLLLEETYI